MGPIFLTRHIRFFLPTIALALSVPIPSKFFKSSLNLCNSATMTFVSPSAVAFSTSARVRNVETTFCLDTLKYITTIPKMKLKAQYNVCILKYIEYSGIFQA